MIQRREGSLWRNWACQEAHKPNIKAQTKQKTSSLQGLFAATTELQEAQLCFCICIVQKLVLWLQILLTYQSYG